MEKIPEFLRHSAKMSQTSLSEMHWGGMIALNEPSAQPGLWPSVPSKSASQTGSP